jgi:hypothetical protein
MLDSFCHALFAPAFFAGELKIVFGLAGAFTVKLLFTPGNGSIGRNKGTFLEEYRSPFTPAVANAPRDKPAPYPRNSDCPGMPGLAFGEASQDLSTSPVSERPLFLKCRWFADVYCLPGPQIQG